MKQILLVEDEANVAEPLVKNLRAEGYNVLWAQSLEQADSHLNESLDLIILDWNLNSDEDGLSWLQKQRQAGIQLPVIFLTARSDLIDKVLGLESGANDYMTKPFEIRELISRIRVQFRDVTPTSESVKFDHLEIRLEAHEVLSNGQRIELTRKEFEVLSLLIEKPNSVFSRNEILNRVWGVDTFITPRTVDNHILQLRQKLATDRLETIRGVGYKFRS